MDANAVFASAVESAASLSGHSSSSSIVRTSVPASSVSNKRVAAQLENGGFQGDSSDSFYSSLGSSFGSYLGPQGTAAGYLAGSALDSLGGLSGAAKKMRSLIGMGDYSLRSNSLVQGGGRSSGPLQIVSQGNRATRIRYREYIGDVFSNPDEPNAFHVVSYPINPGLISTFKWLPPIATQYEQWTPNGIVFEFRSTSSEYVSQQALGSVIMATEYDSYDRPYSSKVEMLNSAYANEAKPSDHIIHGIECDPRDNPNSIFYVRSGPLQGREDIRDYDLGIFYVATQGIPHVNANLGSLYVHYDITFRKEQLYGGLLLNNQLWANFYFHGEPDSSGSHLFPNGTVQVGGNVEDIRLIPPVGCYLPTGTAGVRWLVIFNIQSPIGTEIVFNGPGQALYIRDDISTGISHSETISLNVPSVDTEGLNMVTFATTFVQEEATAYVHWQMNMSPWGTIATWRTSFMQVSTDFTFNL